MTTITDSKKAQELLLNDLQAIGYANADPNTVLKFMNDLSGLSASVVQTATIQQLLTKYKDMIAKFFDQMFYLNSFTNNATGTASTDQSWLTNMATRFANVKIGSVGLLSAEITTLTTNLASFEAATTFNGSRVWRLFPAIDPNLGSAVSTTATLNKDASGNYVWSTTSAPPTVDSYAWNDYKSLITQLIIADQKSGVATTAANPYATLQAKANADIGSFYLDQIGNDIGTAFMILMVMFDGVYSRQQQGLGSTTDLLSTLTDMIAAPLTNLAQSASSQSNQATRAQAEQFSKLIWITKRLADAMPQLSGIKDTLNNAINTLRDTSLSVPTSTGISGGPSATSATFQITLGDLLDIVTTPFATYMSTIYPKMQQKYGATSNEVAAIYNALQNPQKAIELLKSGLSGMASASQPLINGTQQIGSLLTGVSKQVSTNLSVVAQMNSQVINLGSSVGSPTGAYQQMMSGIIHNQRA